MGWMPSIRRGSTRWWLPRTATTTEVMTRLLVREHVTADDPMFRRWLADAIGSDPALFLFCALQIEVSHCDADALARWLILHAPGKFASGDAFLGAPDFTDAMGERFSKLTDHYRTLPLSEWIEDAAMWLEVAGERVPVAWQQQWPSFLAPSSGLKHGGDLPQPIGDPLQQLARSMQRMHSLERSFDVALHKSKLGALKQLAYGLSHEINNPLANISNRAQQLQRAEEDPSRVATLQRIIDQVYRAHEMIADLMFYANPPATSLGPCDLVQLVEGVSSDFDEETKRQSIRTELSLPASCVLNQVDGGMIGEALRVLIRNAIEAIGCQGTIVISMVEDADRVQIHVADSGPGVSSEAREHAFDPYYSGREAGRGLGLGLCRAYRIAKLHHGEITLAGGPAGCVATLTL